jgi:hypothetical protein
MEMKSVPVDFPSIIFEIIVTLRFIVVTLILVVQQYVTYDYYSVDFSSY